MASYNHKISDQSKVKFNPVSRELENTESALPSVTSSDEGKVLTVDSSGEWVAAEDSGIPFSTSEVKIGEMGGKGVYQKTFEVPNINPTGSKTISDTGLTINDKILGIFGTVRTVNSVYQSVDYTVQFLDEVSGVTTKISLSATTGGLRNIIIKSSGNVQSNVTYSAIITIVYVKNNS